MKKKKDENQGLTASFGPGYPELDLELEPALIYFLELELEVLYKSQDPPPNTGYFVAHK